MKMMQQNLTKPYLTVKSVQVEADQLQVRAKDCNVNEDDYGEECDDNSAG
jgi:hypothetical protein